MDPIIKVDKVNVIYNEGEGSQEVHALTDISIEIFPKEYVVFFGPSGCGKSTLMNVIAGLERVSSGTVVVAGRDLNDLTDEELAMYHRHELGFIFQAYNLISTLSVVENIGLPQMFDGLPKSEWHKNAYKMAERFSIQEHAKKLPQELSGGQQQRVGISRALVNNPAILLADEPTGNLDSKNVRNVLDIFQGLNLEEHKTLVLVTHSSDYLGEADRIIYLKDGKIIDEMRNKHRHLFKVEEKKTQKGEEFDESHVVPWKRFLKDAFIPPSLKSEKLTEFILHIPEENKMERVEMLIEKRLEGIITKDELAKQLDVSYYRGGAGLDSRVARRWSAMVEHVILNASAINTLASFPEDKAAELLLALRENIEALFRLKFTDKQRAFLEGVMHDRLKNIIGPLQVKKQLNMPVKKEGMGLRRQTALKLMNYLELIILISARAVPSAEHTVASPTLPSPPDAQ